MIFALLELMLIAAWFLLDLEDYRVVGIEKGWALYNKKTQKFVWRLSK